MIFNRSFYVQWLSSVSLSLAIYAFWEKFVPSEKKILSETELKENKTAVEELKIKFLGSDNQTSEAEITTAEQVKVREDPNHKKIIISNNKNIK